MSTPPDIAARLRELDRDFSRLMEAETANLVAATTEGRVVVLERVFLEANILRLKLAQLVKALDYRNHLH